MQFLYWYKEKEQVQKPYTRQVQITEHDNLLANVLTIHQLYSIELLIRKDGTTCKYKCQDSRYIQLDFVYISTSTDKSSNFNMFHFCIQQWTQLFIDNATVGLIQGGGFSIILFRSPVLNATVKESLKLVYTAVRVPICTSKDGSQ